MNKLFTPDTLADGYEAALLDTMNRLSLRQEIISTVKVLRESHPGVYMRLCYIAKENDKFALRDTIVILVEIGFLPDTDDETSPLIDTHDAHFDEVDYYDYDEDNDETTAS